MKHRVVIKRLAAISIGAAIMGLGLNTFNLANSLTEGGVAGLSLLAKLLFDLNPGLGVLLLNIPLLLWGGRVLGWRAVGYSAYGALMLASFLWLFGDMRLPLNDTLLAAIYAGLAYGIGAGIVFRFGGTTGGLDIVVKVAQRRFGWPVGVTMLWLDISVLALSVLVIDLAHVMYTLIAVFIGARLLDLVEMGAYRAKALMVVSQLEDQLIPLVVEELGRGATILRGVGAYSAKERDVLYIVCLHGEVHRLKECLRGADPQAFITVFDVHEVLGGGFSHRGG